MWARSAKNHEGTVSKVLPAQKSALHEDDRMRQLRRNEAASRAWTVHRLLSACLQAPQGTVCSECGRMMRKATKDLCPACYYRTRPRSTKMIECVSCGETKPHAAHGLCYKCYLRWGENYTERKREFQNKRCGTCNRLLRLVRSRVDMRTKFCDRFCRGHNPETECERQHQTDARGDSSGVAAPQG